MSGARTGEPLIVARGVSHHYGEDQLRKQVLYDIDLEVRTGEIVILTGPSGSGKTTLLTLCGALRATQQGSLRVLGEELLGSDPRRRVDLRRRIGYIFQGHNLVAALTARQNVQLGVALSERRAPGRADELLASVGLGDHRSKYPRQLSGGQKQRVAVARALAVEPRIVLADEPTAALDRRSGQEVVELLQDLARRQGSAVLIVTHDNRILDVADTVVHLDDGRLDSLASAFTSDAQRVLGALARTSQGGDLAERLQRMPLAEFATFLGQVTDDFQRLLGALDLSREAAFESTLEQVLTAFTHRIGELLDAERASLFVVDEARGELWSKVSEDAGEIRFPLGQGIAGEVVRTGRPMNVPDAYAEPLFNRAIDRETGYRTRSLLCMPIEDREGRAFAVMQVLNKAGGGPFDGEDEARFREFADRLGVVLETWKLMRETTRQG